MTSILRDVTYPLGTRYEGDACKLVVLLTLPPIIPIVDLDEALRRFVDTMQGIVENLAGIAPLRFTVDVSGNILTVTVWASGMDTTGLMDVQFALYQVPPLYEAAVANTVLNLLWEVTSVEVVIDDYPRIDVLGTLGWTVATLGGLIFIWQYFKRR